MASPDSHPLPFEGQNTVKFVSFCRQHQHRSARPGAQFSQDVKALDIGSMNPARSNRSCRLSPRACLRRRYARPISRTPQPPGTVARGHTDPDRRRRSAGVHAFAWLLPVWQIGSYVEPARYKAGSILTVDFGIAQSVGSHSTE